MVHAIKNSAFRILENHEFLFNSHDLWLSKKNSTWIKGINLQQKQSINQIEATL